MVIYLILCIISIIAMVSLIFTLIYLIKDEKNLKEVDNKYLKELGKTYTQSEFEQAMYKMYINIITGIDNDDYNYLKDAVSDEEYNKLLYLKKEDKEKDVAHVKTNINKECSKLVSFKVINGLEIAKLWVKYNCNEYKSRLIDKKDDMGRPYTEEEIVSGSKTNIVSYNYILTFARTRTETEKTICPLCGYESDISISSKCERCDGTIIKKSSHWVYVGKEKSNFQ